MKLLIAIPALNEAEAIDAIITRSLAAKEAIIAGSPVDDVSITVVSDGSTDETVERARKYVPDIGLVIFPENKGYGAAIKEAWDRSDADLLGFLDADGTCDPRFFTTLCSQLVGEDADVAVGCRMNPESEMPGTRKLGNTIFATMLTYMSAKGVRDVASGMRVVRRSVLPRLYPLPDGLHFTPAMSARVLLGGDLRMVEIDMPYKERTGRSKLSVVKDGARFLRIISQTAFLYRPGRILWSLAVLALVASGAMVAAPLAYYASHGSLQDWMIYRCTAAALLVVTAVLLFSGGYLATRVTDLAIFHRDSGGLQGRGRRLVGSSAFLVLPLVSFAASIALAWSGFADYLDTGHVHTHWSRVIAIFTLLIISVILVLLKVLNVGIQLVQQRDRYAVTTAAPLSVQRSEQAGDGHVEVDASADARR